LTTKIHDSPFQESLFLSISLLCISQLNSFTLPLSISAL